MQSQLILSTKLSADGKTRLDQYFVSPPFKLMTLPDEHNDHSGELRAIQMSSSPGLLAGDDLTVRITLAKHTALSLTTQAFTRVQAMNEGETARQHTQIELAENSRLLYLPHPLVLHKDSALQQETQIEMAQGACVIYGEITAIGRVLNGERFAFRAFSSYLCILHRDRPILSDRIYWRPAEMSLTAIGQMEAFTHQGTLVYVNLSLTAAEIKALTESLQRDYASTDKIMIGISQLHYGGLILRTLAYRADVIEIFFAAVVNRLKNVANHNE